MRDIGSALAGRDREGEIAADQPVHAARRIADGIDRRAGLECLQLAAVEHDLAERRRREAQPALPRNDRMRLRRVGMVARFDSAAVDNCAITAAWRDT